MAKPNLQPVAQELYFVCEPLQFDEPLYDYALAKMIQALTLADEEPFFFSEDITALVDIDRTPDKALPWLGQFFGVRPRPDLGSQEQRDRIRETDGWNRGTVGSIIGAARQTLTGPKRVAVHERDTGPYHYNVITYADETPDPDAVLRDLQAAKPVGLNFEYQVVDGQTFRDVRDTGSTFGDVRDDYLTFQGLRDAQLGA